MLYSPNSFKVLCTDGSIAVVLPLSYIARMLFVSDAEELLAYMRAQPEATLEKLLSQDTLCQALVQACLHHFGLSLAKLDADTVATLLLPHEIGDEVHHRGLLFEQNFKQQPEVGSIVTKEQMEQMFYETLAKLSLHYSSAAEALHLAQTLPADVLERLTEERSKLMKTPDQVKAEKVADGKKQAKQKLQAMLGGKS